MDREQRIRALDKVIEQLVNDPAHPDWELVDQYLTVFRDLPATLDLMDRFTHAPQAIALALLRADQSLFTATWSLFEQLPFSWHLMPIAAWVQATKALVEAYRAFNSQNIRGMLRRSFFRRLRRSSNARRRRWHI
jgi:hypothetical protein